MFSLKEETAAVIGATGTLGGIIAQALAHTGAAVALLGRNAVRGQACVNHITSAGGRAAFFSADALNRCSLEAARAGIEQSLGPVGVLVNAVGRNDRKVTISEDKTFAALALED